MPGTRIPASGKQTIQTAFRVPIFLLRSGKHTTVQRIFNGLSSHVAYSCLFIVTLKGRTWPLLESLSYEIGKMCGPAERSGTGILFYRGNDGYNNVSHVIFVYGTNVDIHLPGMDFEF
jgi:hypothetical protein